MGAIDFSKESSNVVIRFPEKITGVVASKARFHIDKVSNNGTIIFDFSKTQLIDRDFYPFLHRLKIKGRQFESIHISPHLKEELGNRGVLSLFNSKKKVESNKKKGPSKIPVDFIQPFIDSTIKILDVQTGVKSHCKGPRLKNDTDDQKIDVMGSLALVSPVFSGNISICFPAETYLSVVSNMLAEEYTEIDDELADAVGEILNIIFGTTKTILNDTKGYSLEKAIPQVIAGKELRLRQTQGAAIILVFESDAGPFHMEIELITT